jgi:hypothetical protein
MRCETSLSLMLHKAARACITHLGKHDRQFRCHVSRASVAALDRKSGAFDQRESKRNMKKVQGKGVWGLRGIMRDGGVCHMAIKDAVEAARIRLTRLQAGWEH